MTGRRAAPGCRVDVYTLRFLCTFGMAATHLAMRGALIFAALSNAAFFTAEPAAALALSLASTNEERVFSPKKKVAAEARRQRELQRMVASSVGGGSSAGCTD